MKLKKVKPMKECVMATCAVVALLLLLAGILSFGQNAPKPAQTTPETIQCTRNRDAHRKYLQYKDRR
jgi:hypothetical protein